jgi:hypothetical protein
VQRLADLAAQHALAFAQLALEDLALRSGEVEHGLS